MKLCSHCHEELPTEAFGRDKGRHDGLAMRCKDCERERDRARYEKARKKAQVVA